MKSPCEVNRVHLLSSCKHPAYIYNKRDRGTNILDKGRVEVHQNASDALAMVKSHTVAMDFEPILLFAHQNHSTICRSLHWISFIRTIVYTPMIISDKPSGAPLNKNSTTLGYLDPLHRVKYLVSPTLFAKGLN